MKTSGLTMMLAIGLGAGLCWAACGDDDAYQPVVAAFDQSIEVPNQVTVAEATMDQPGWVVVHESGEEGPGDAIGYEALDRGENREIEVGLNRNVIDGETLIAMLHVDAGEFGTFEFPGVDVAVTGDDGQPVMTSFTVERASAGPSIVVGDQTLDLVSTRVMVDEVLSEGPGWLSVREDEAGEPGTVIGYHQVNDGVNPEFPVVLARPLEDGEVLHTVLHVDEGQLGTFEYPGDDGQAMDGVEPVEASFSVLVPDGTPAVILSVEKVEILAYDFMAVVPIDMEEDVRGGQEVNQTLHLRQGWRYQIDNADHEDFPIEIIEAGALPVDDTVLLSQIDPGTLEADPGIDWFEDQMGSVWFTMTPELAGMVDGYRCSVNPDEMRGIIEVQ